MMMIKDVVGFCDCVFVSMLNAGVFFFLIVA